MINENFFPTPQNVIDLMLAPYAEAYDVDRYDHDTHERITKMWVIHYNRILEPSAGKGDIADRLVKYYHRRDTDISVIEIEQELQSILSAKRYRLIDSDFLQYKGNYYFDFVILNPPFPNADEHLLKAWEVVAPGGDVVCIMNAETLRNPYSGKRKMVLDLIEKHGRYEEVGAVFAQAERPTNAECAIVWLHKPEKDSKISFDDVFLETDAVIQDSEYEAYPLASPDLIKSLVDGYENAVQLLIEMRALRSKYTFYTKSVIEPEWKDLKKSDDERAQEAEVKQQQSLEDEIDQLKMHYWKYIFNRTKLGEKTTSNFQKKFQETLVRTKFMAFSEANIMSVLNVFYESVPDILKECIVEVFDRATKYHEKNIVVDEAWKTNKSWKISKKIIMPRAVQYEKGYSWSEQYRDSEFFVDIDKVLCFITGKEIDKIVKLKDAIRKQILEINQKHIRYDQKFYSTFFEVRFFKKGTVHITFLDLDVLARFNIAAAENKNWVGGGY